MAVQDSIPLELAPPSGGARVIGVLRTLRRLPTIPMFLLMLLLVTGIFAPLLAPHNERVGSLNDKGIPPFWVGSETEFKTVVSDDVFLPEADKIKLRAATFTEIAFHQPDFVTCCELSRYRNEALTKIFNVRGGKIALQGFFKAFAAHQAGPGQHHIEIGQHSCFCQAARPTLDCWKMTGEPEAADKRPDRGASDDIRTEPNLIEALDNPNMGPAAGDAAA